MQRTGSVSPGFRPAPQPFTETAARSAPGVPVLLGGIVALLVAIGLFTRHPSGAAHAGAGRARHLLVLAAALGLRLA